MVLITGYVLASLVKFCQTCYLFLTYPSFLSKRRRTDILNSSVSESRSNASLWRQWWRKSTFVLRVILFIYFFLFFFFNFILFLNFTILYWFCQTSKWIHHRYTCVPHPEPSSLPIPSLWVIPVHQPQASSIVHRTWTGDSFHTWYYMYFNAILPNHPTLSLYHRVQKTVLYISVSFAVLYTGLLLPSF